MRRLVARLVYFLRSAARGLAASPVTSVVAVVTIGMSLVLVGAFALLVLNMEELLDRFGEDLRVTAWLETGVDAEAQSRLVESARGVEGVAQVRLVSEAEALERFRAGVGRGADLLEGLDENPLPASLEIVLVPERRSADGMRSVVEALEGLPGVDELASGEDWVEGYLRAVGFVRGLGLGLAAILAVATLLIVGNTIRLAVVARRDELEILSLVGASRAFVSTPFLIEGVLQGALGGTLALLLLYGLFRLVLPELELGLELVLGGLSPRFLSGAEALWLVGSGAALGLVGAGVAVSGGLRA